MGISWVSLSSSWRINSSQNTGAGLQSPWVLRCLIHQGAGLMTHVSPHIVPGLRHLVLGEIDLVGDVLVFHGADPFKIGPFQWETSKRPSSHQKSPGRSLWDKSLKLLRCHPNWRKLAHSATCQHTSFLGNGEKPVGTYWESRSVRPLQSIRGALLTAIPPPAALLEKGHPCTRLRHRFVWAEFTPK